MCKHTSWIAAFLLLLLVTPPLAIAQRRGNGTTSPNSANRGNYPTDTDSALKDIQLAAAVQATEEQRSQSRLWNQDTDAVKRLLQELQNAVATDNFSTQLSALNAAIEKSNADYHDFVGNLTKEQKAGLKKQIQKLGKTNEALIKAGLGATRELGPASSSAKRASKMEKIKTAIDNLQGAQKEIAAEMGMAAQ